MDMVVSIISVWFSSIDFSTQKLHQWIKIYALENIKTSRKPRKYVCWIDLPVFFLFRKAKCILRVIDISLSWLCAEMVRIGYTVLFHRVHLLFLYSVKIPKRSRILKLIRQWLILNSQRAMILKQWSQTWAFSISRKFACNVLLGTTLDVLTHEPRGQQSEWMFLPELRIVILFHSLCLKTAII
jgi:hypothetical protein